jgi:hypothetical protein
MRGSKDPSQAKKVARWKRSSRYVVCARAVFIRNPIQDSPGIVDLLCDAHGMEWIGRMEFIRDTRVVAIA